MLHLPDWSRIDLPEHERHIRDAFGVNSALYLPLLREANASACWCSWKAGQQLRPGEIAEAESFRDQAVIAIENARLFNETQEALEQQKASAEVLGAISKSVADTAPVFETILDACQRLFGSEEIGIYTIGDDDMVRVAAWRGPRAEEARRDVTPLAESVTGRVIRERRTHHIPDLGASPICPRRCAIGWTAMAAHRSSMRRCCGRSADSARSSWSAGRRGPSPTGNRRCCRRSPIRR